MYEIVRFELWVAKIAAPEAEVVSDANGDETGPSAQDTEPGANAPDDGFG